MCMQNLIDFDKEQIVMARGLGQDDVNGHVFVRNLLEVTKPCILSLSVWMYCKSLSARYQRTQSEVMWSPCQ